MRTRVAVISIIVEEGTSAEELNALLSDDGTYIIGRMGIPYREKGVNIICVAIDAPEDVINALSGQLGRLPNVTSKVTYSSVVTDTDVLADEDGQDPC